MYYKFAISWHWLTEKGGGRGLVEYQQRNKVWKVVLSILPKYFTTPDPSYKVTM